MEPIFSSGGVTQTIKGVKNTPYRIGLKTCILLQRMGRGSNTAKVVLLIVHAFGWFGLSLTEATEKTIILNVTSDHVMPPPTDVPPQWSIFGTHLLAVDDKFVYVQRFIISDDDKSWYFSQIDVSTLLGYTKINGVPGPGPFTSYIMFVISDIAYFICSSMLES